MSQSDILNISKDQKHTLPSHFDIVNLGGRGDRDSCTIRWRRIPNNTINLNCSVYMESCSKLNAKSYIYQRSHLAILCFRDGLATFLKRACLRKPEWVSAQIRALVHTRFLPARLQKYMKLSTTEDFRYIAEGDSSRIDVVSEFRFIQRKFPSPAALCFAFGQESYRT